MLVALTKKGASGLMAAFRRFLFQVPFNLHLAYEAYKVYCQRFFLWPLAAVTAKGKVGEEIQRASEGVNRL
jgi:hypothetical protein